MVTISLSQLESCKPNKLSALSLRHYILAQSCLDKAGTERFQNLFPLLGQDYVLGLLLQMENFEHFYVTI